MTFSSISLSFLRHLNESGEESGEEVGMGSNNPDTNNSHVTQLTKGGEFRMENQTNPISLGSALRLLMDAFMKERAMLYSGALGLFLGLDRLFIDDDF